jgi:hypothetical protein
MVMLYSSNDSELLAGLKPAPVVLFLTKTHPDTKSLQHRHSAKKSTTTRKPGGLKSPEKKR